MILRGRDAMIEAAVIRWMRRISGQSGSSSDTPKKDETWPGRIPAPELPQAATGTGGGSGGPGFPPPAQPIPPGDPVIVPTMIYGDPNYQAPLLDLHTATDADVEAIAAAVEISGKGNRVYEHEKDDLQPIFTFGGLTDWAQVRGSATYAPLTATTAATPNPVPKMVQFWSRSNSYTDVRVAASSGVGKTTLWLRGSFAGNVANGYCARADPVALTITIFHVSANVFTQLASMVTGGGYGPKFTFEARGTQLSFYDSSGDMTLTVNDAKYTKGYVGWGDQDQDAADTIVNFEVTPTTI